MGADGFVRRERERSIGERVRYDEAVERIPCPSERAGLSPQCSNVTGGFLAAMVGQYVPDVIYGARTRPISWSTSISTTVME